LVLELVWFGLVVVLPLGFTGGGLSPPDPPTGVGKQLSAVASDVAVGQQLMLSLSWAV
jgi:hypothetical protein